MSAGGGTAIVQRLYAAFNEGDDEGVIALLGPEAEIAAADEHGIQLEGVRYRGAEGIREYLSGLRSVARHIVVQVGTIQESGDRVVTTLSVTGFTGAPEREFSINAVHFFGIRDGRVAWLRSHRTKNADLIREGWRPR